jgi:hypothetical protein
MTKISQGLKQSLTLLKTSLTSFKISLTSFKTSLINIRAVTIVSNPIFAFLVGLAIGLIAIIPDAFLEWYYRLFLAFIFIICLYFIFYGIEIRNDKIEISKKIEQYNNLLKESEKQLQELNRLRNLITQFIQVKSEHWLFKLKDGGDVEITRTIKIENPLSEPISRPYSILMFYDIYDYEKNNMKDNSIPEIRSIEIDGVSIEKKLGYKAAGQYKPRGILKKNDGSYEGLGWTIIPIEKLGSNESMLIKIVHDQKNIFKKMTELYEMAGARIFLPTDQLIIVVEPPPGKQIFPKVLEEKSQPIKIMNSELNLEETAEETQINLPKFRDNRIVEWEISQPKIGLSYWVVFKVE